MSEQLKSHHFSLFSKYYLDSPNSECLCLISREKEWKQVQKQPRAILTGTKCSAGKAV